MSLFACCVVSVSAQTSIETFCVYDVNHDAIVTAEDVAKVADHALKTNADSPQTVDAAALNALLRSIDSRLARIDDALGIEDEESASHEYVNLGLPSGTLWATCNVGASAPEEYGDHFAWGETHPKDDYDMDTYELCYSETGAMSKYCTDSNYGIVDNKTGLELKDDAAYVNWGKRWRMPSLE